MNNDFERINKIANQTNINDFRIEQGSSGIPVVDTTDSVVVKSLTILG